MGSGSEDSFSNILSVISPGLDDRAMDNWAPLVAIADQAAGQEDGLGVGTSIVPLHFPRAKRSARLQDRTYYETLSTSLRTIIRCSRISDNQDHREALLKEDGPGRATVFSAESRLILGDSRNCCELFEVQSTNMRDGPRVVKGYKRTNLEEAWKRWLDEPTDPDAERYGQLVSPRPWSLPRWADDLTEPPGR